MVDFEGFHVGKYTVRPMDPRVLWLFEGAGVSHITVGILCPCKTTRWAPTSYKWSYNPYKWPYKWVCLGLFHPTYRSYKPSYKW